jgi:hypothetical protein
MHISSVRSLKEELKTGPAMPAAFARALAVSRTARTVSARAASLHTREPKTTRVALGIAAGRRKGDYCLSARVQLRGSAARRLAKTIEQQSRGECDVRLVPDVRKRLGPGFFQARRRPLEAGASVGLAATPAAGTLGFVVEDDDAYYALSNNHVLADVNAADPGDPVAQPGPLDRNPTAATLIGVLDRYVPISFRRSNVVDCAAAMLLEDVEFFQGWTEAIPGVVRGVHRITEADLGRTVRKAGRTTGVTEGTITSVDVDRLQVDMGEPGRPRIAVFSDQIEIAGKDGSLFSDSGDSGSLIVDDRDRAVALLFSGGQDENGIDLTFANRIERVLSKLGVSLVV